MKHFALLASAALLAYPLTAQAQSSPSNYTSAARYDASGRLTGTIAPSPDFANNLFQAVRNTYDAAGRLTKVEAGYLTSWQGESVAPSAWSSFSVVKSTETVYDPMGRKLQVSEVSSGSTYALTQYSYDSVGRLQCTATRMNPSAYSSVSSNACILGPEGSYGPDRITRNSYDAASQLLKVEEAVGTSLQQDHATYTYSVTGKQTSMTDAGGNKAAFEYDGHDRQVRWRFPSKTSVGSVSTDDYEEYGYDPNGNRTSLRKRDARTFTFNYDALNRVTSKIVPDYCVSGYACTQPSLSATRDVYYGYDLQGRQRYARFDSASGEGVEMLYTGFGELERTISTMGGYTRTLVNSYDANSNRYQLQHPDGNYVYTYVDGLDRPYYSLMNGSDMSFYVAFNSGGLPAVLYRTWSAYRYISYDQMLRPNWEQSVFASSGYNSVTTTAFNPASQVISRSRDNDAFAFSGFFNRSRGYAVNGLNQYTAVGGTGFGYDSNGNLASDGVSSFSYDAENRLVAASGGVSLVYDPLGRLFQVTGGSGTTQFLYDGDALVAEYNGSGTMLRRYVHGAGADVPMVWYEGAGLSSKRFLYPDSQGSIVAVTDGAASVTNVNSYDEYGIPAAGNTGRFQYTGQAWIPELGMYHYKARVYSPVIGRFLQTDPIGYEDQVNLYAYVGNDPVNHTDPTGEQCVNPRGTECPNLTATAATTGTAILTREGLGAERARAQYKQAVAKLAPNDTQGRSAAKAAARAASPPITRGVTDFLRPGLGPKPGSGGTANRTNSGADKLAGRLGNVGRVAGVAGVAVGAARVATSDKPVQEAAKVGGGIAGAIVGAEVFGALGSAAGPVGTVVGGIGGGILGGYFGEEAVNKLIDW